jgi:hypothetical protein
MEDKCPKWLVRMKNNQTLGKILLLLMALLLAVALTRCSFFVNDVKSEQPHAVKTAEACEFHGWILNQAPDPCYVQVSKVCEHQDERLVIYEGVVYPGQRPVKIGIEPGTFYFYVFNLATQDEEWSEYTYTYEDLKKNWDNGLVPYFVIHKKRKAKIL